jgi:hypothetical protein
MLTAPNRKPGQCFFNSNIGEKDRIDNTSNKGHDIKDVTIAHTHTTC